MRQKTDTNHHRRAMTLVEVTASMVIMSFVFVVSVSAIHVVTRGGTGLAESSAEYSDVSMILARMKTEVAHAKSFSEFTPSAITFVTLDVTGDNVDDKVRYAWSGTEGDPLTRSVNDGDVVDVLDNVKSLDFKHEFLLTASQPSGSDGTPPISIIAQFAASTGVSTPTISILLGVAQCFSPDLPVGATSWDLTRIEFMAAVAGSATGEMQVELTRPTALNLPGSAVLESTRIQESSLGISFAWQSISFSNINGMLPSESLCMSIMGTTLFGDGRVQVASSGNSGYSTNSGGLGWVPVTERPLIFRAYGRIYGGADSSTGVMTAVHISLECDTETPLRVDCAVPVLNRPVVTVQ